MLFDLNLTEKVFSLIAAITAIISFFYLYRKRAATIDRSTHTLENRNASAQSVVINLGDINQGEAGVSEKSNETELKATKNILFIDDEKDFKIVTILKKMGWAHTRIVSDLSSLEYPILKDADVVFVDIQGVGKIMQYRDEGLGLALAIKRRHPNKKVVIYSAQEHGPRFHEAHQVADYSLPKTAEPIRFEEVILKVLRS